MFKNKKSNKGFTLIEILIVIGIIAILATIVIIAINPARQFAQARNTQRTSNVNSILNAVGQKIADCKGKFDATATECPTSTPACPPLPPPLAITQETRNIIITGASDTTNINLSCLVPNYMTALPFDPQATSTTDTGYDLIIESVANGGRITIKAATVELSNPISITR